MEQETHFIALSPHLFTVIGHQESYHTAIESVARKNGWSHALGAPKKCMIDPLPENWSKCLDVPVPRHIIDPMRTSHWKRPHRHERIRQNILYFLSLRKFLRKELKKKRKKIIFIESFALNDIQVLTRVLLTLHLKNTQVWLLYRYDPEEMVNEGPAFMQAHKKILEKVGDDNLKLLCDSNPLKILQAPYFKRVVSVVPVIHVQDIEPKAPSFEKKRDIVAWWPGSVNKAKGLDYIELLSKSLLKDAKNLTLVFGKSASISETVSGPKIQELEDHLERGDYINWLNKCDLILLPYIHKAYKSSTSGVFVEAILAGKIPVVMKETWMAHELKTHDLEELIVNWDDLNLIETLFKLSQNRQIKEKLKKLHDHYIAFHSINGCAKMMNQLINNTFV